MVLSLKQGEIPFPSQSGEIPMRKQCSTMSKPLSKVPRRYLIAEYMNSEFDFGKWHKISHHTISIPNIFFKYIVIKIVYIYIYRSMIALIHGHAA